MLEEIDYRLDWTSYYFLYRVVPTSDISQGMEDNTHKYLQGTQMNYITLRPNWPQYQSFHNGCSVPSDMKVLIPHCFLKDL